MVESPPRTFSLTAKASPRQCLGSEAGSEDEDEDGAEGTGGQPMVAPGLLSLARFVNPF